MNDVISRQAAIDAFGCVADRQLIGEKSIRHVLSELPSAQPDLDEWCTDCREYDHERNCCPRWSRVIRQAVDEAKQYAQSGRGEQISDG